MDIEFHYYITYLIAARAGFRPAEAAIVAQAAQEIDNNHVPISVSRGTPAEYESVISQTMDILHPMHNERIYPIFHFIPGDPAAPSARRRDGASSVWVTTPNSSLANEMLDAALRSDDLFRIGASAHAFADTWAHQNFLGKDDPYNEMPNETFAEKMEGIVKLMRIGHALAGHQPDIPGLIWTDGRLIDSEVDNTNRFMDAADHLFRKLAVYTRPEIARLEVDRTAASLIADLRADIGPSSRTNKALDPARIARYRQRAMTAPYGVTAIPNYQEGKWSDAAFMEQHADLGPKIATFLAENAGFVGDILDFGTRLTCTWKDAAIYKQTQWYKFQEAVKAHLDECWDVLTRRLPDLVV